MPDTDMHYAVALHRRGGAVLRVNVQSGYDLSPGAFAIEDAGVLWKRCDDGSAWEQVLVPREEDTIFQARRPVSDPYPRGPGALDGAPGAFLQGSAPVP